MHRASGGSQRGSDRGAGGRGDAAVGVGFLAAAPGQCCLGAEGGAATEGSSGRRPARPDSYLAPSDHDCPAEVGRGVQHRDPAPEIDWGASRPLQRDLPAVFGILLDGAAAGRDVQGGPSLRGAAAPPVRTGARDGLPPAPASHCRRLHGPCPDSMHGRVGGGHGGRQAPHGPRHDGGCQRRDVRHILVALPVRPPFPGAAVRGRHATAGAADLKL
mmetsp:Transcript_4007/g.11171  ORF Transcript_4007/g.11171 Transcript_4007/m.11171 type:complete len:216 (+) Transcript_4007:784-1431(+)